MRVKCSTILGHKYEPRYSYGSPSKIEVENVRENGLVRLLEASKPRTYIYDICIRCGHTISKEGSCNERT